MLNFRFEKSGDSGLLIFDGELTGERIGRLKEALPVSLDNAEHVVVSFNRVTKIDSICISLFSLFCRKSKKTEETSDTDREIYKQMERSSREMVTDRCSVRQCALTANINAMA